MVLDSERIQKTISFSLNTKVFRYSLTLPTEMS